MNNVFRKRRDIEFSFYSRLLFLSGLAVNVSIKTIKIGNKLHKKNFQLDVSKDNTKKPTSVAIEIETVRFRYLFILYTLFKQLEYFAFSSNLF